MIFSLEVLQANHGDCLLLHYGKPTSLKLIVIDGGPKDIYPNFLRKRLEEIKSSRSPDSALVISMVMVSHLDDDHINGVCEMFAELANGDHSLFKIKNLWLNTFDDIIGNVQLPGIAAIGASVNPVNIASIGQPELLNAPEEEQAVIATTAQGRQIIKDAAALTVAVNHPFSVLEDTNATLVRGDIAESVVAWDSQLTFTVLCPGEKRLKSLQRKWDEDLKKLMERGEEGITPASVISFDTSPFNVSSIVCLAQVGDKTMLLTGDGRTDDILKGLEGKGLLEADGIFKVDILKLPHHGADRNIRADFFDRVKADHYIISADGAHHNPDQVVLDMIVEHVTEGKLYLTNRDGKLGLGAKMDAFLQQIEDSGSNLEVIFLGEDQTSITIDLEDEINF